MHINTHEYTKCYFNTNCRELPVNYSKIIYDYSCLSLLIRVEKEKLSILMFNLKFMYAMKKETIKFVIQLVISILTAIATTLGVTSCM